MNRLILPFLTFLTAVPGPMPQTIAASAPVPESIQFNRDVRPILSENCFQCHGPDKDKRKANLRLDRSDSAFAERDGRRAVVPGKLIESELYRRITTHDADDQMPPPDSGRQLTERDRQILRLWIESGAEWQAHWSYIPPVRPNLPAISSRTTARNPIDRFIVSRLEKEQINPSSEADRRTLLRRLSFDLTGLPPSPEEVRAFVESADPLAYEAEVERLLASPHFGERMAVHWLDLVRYADTDGYHGDNYRSVYPYRDYVIDAFNQNIPFDQFTLEQIAGDLLPGAGRRQKIASTFNRLNRTTEEGGSQPKEYLAKYAGDRVRTTSSVWLGATLGCAECHDHKFDPFTAKDFYSFAAFFADVKEVGVGRPEAVPIPTIDQERELAEHSTQIAALEKQLQQPTPELLVAQRVWETNVLNLLASKQLGWQPVKPETFEARNGSKLVLNDDLSVLVTGPNPDKEEYIVTLPIGNHPVTALRLEALTHPDHDNGSLSRGNGNFVLTGFEADLIKPGESESARLKFASALADYSQNGFPVAAAIDDKPQTGWAVDGSSKKENRAAAFVIAEPIPPIPGGALKVRLKFESQYQRHHIGRFRLSVIQQPQPTLDSEGLPAAVTESLKAPSESRTGEQARLLSAHFLKSAPELDPVRNDLAAARKQKEDFFKSLPTSLVTVSVEPRSMRVLPRGNWLDESGPVVKPAVPEFLSIAPQTDETVNRIHLARWLASRENPLTSRVFVNRLWKMLFGSALSKVVDDLGSQGEWPKHPELLDWLAAEFIESGWNVKHVIRLMVTSATYRQTSDFPETLRERDPFNRLYARQSRFRLEAETIRDNALAISGLLTRQVGGPSARPYQPAGYWDQLNFPKRVYENDQGAAAYRRGLYTYWCRTFPHPSLTAFDAPSREECTAERVVSNTPLQALVLLNDPTYVEAARVFAERILRHSAADPQGRVMWAFHQTLARNPSLEETKLLLSLFEAELTRQRSAPGQAEKIAAVGLRPVAKDLDAAELAAWTAVSRTLLNLQETIARY